MQLGQIGRLQHSVMCRARLNDFLSGGKDEEQARHNVVFSSTTLGPTVAFLYIEDKIWSLIKNYKNTVDDGEALMVVVEIKGCDRTWVGRDLSCSSLY